MRRPSFTNRFRRDVKRMEKRGKKMDKLKGTIRLLVDGEELPERFRDHQLVGNFKGRRECHMEPDWLLIYKLSDEEILFERTGTHGSFRLRRLGLSTPGSSKISRRPDASS